MKAVKKGLQSLRLLKDIKLYVSLNIVNGILNSFLGIFVIIFPRKIVDSVLTGGFATAIEAAVLFLICNLITVCIKAFVTYSVANQREHTNKYFDEKLKNKFMELEYQKIETSSILDRKEKARIGSTNIIELVDNISILISGLFTISYVCYLLFQMSIILVLLVIATVMFSSFLNYRRIKVEERLRENFVVLNRKWDYLNYVCRDKDNSKEIRLNSLSTWLSDKIRFFVEDNERLIKENYRAATKANVGDALGQNTQSLIVYLYLAYRVALDLITVGEFFQYVTVAAMLSDNLSKLAKSFQTGLKNVKFIYSYDEFLCEENACDGELDMPENMESFTLGIRNISFKYPNTDRYILKNFSLTIHNGEKVSIVGLNGAGKTTLIKLILRLYTLEEGDILLNGVDIRQYRLEGYRKKFSAVFQDFKIFSFNIRDNILMADMSEEDTGPIDAKKEEKVYAALHDVEYTEKIVSLKDGLDTYMLRDYDENGIELSGGMQQKTALCRAYYRNPKMLILDEPTSMLDPIEEYKMYQSLSKLTADKTAIFISHRLASSKFCDRIAYIENGSVEEIGSHDDLMELSGKYYLLFNTQAQYYEKINEIL